MMRQMLALENSCQSWDEYMMNVFKICVLWAPVEQDNAEE
jgi:hypothetical protein